MFSLFKKISMVLVVSSLGIVPISAVADEVHIYHHYDQADRDAKIAGDFLNFMGKMMEGVMSQPHHHHRAPQIVIRPRYNDDRHHHDGMHYHDHGHDRLNDKYRYNPRDLYGTNRRYNPPVSCNLYELHTMPGHERIKPHGGNGSHSHKVYGKYHRNNHHTHPYCE